MSPADASVSSSDAGASAETVLSERAILQVTSLGHTVCHIGELVFTGVLIAVRDEFGLRYYEVTALGLLGYLLMGFGALPVGFLTDRYGSLRLFRIYYPLMALSGFLVALAPNALGLFLGLTLLGVATSIYHPAALTMISLGIKERSHAMGINGVAGNVGVATGPVLGLLAAATGHWRLAYVVVGILSLAGAVFLEWSCRRASSAPEHAPVSCPSEHVSGPVGNGRLARSLVPQVFLLAAMMLGGLNYRCLVTALPTYLGNEEPAEAQAKLPAADLKPVQFSGLAVFSVFLTLVVGCVGQYFGGSMAGRLGSSRIYLGCIAGLVPLAVLLGTLNGLPLAAGAVAAALAFCLFAQQPVENTIMAETTSAGRRSTSYGMKFTLTFGFGALGSQVVGFLWDRFDSLAPVFFLIACSGVVMGLLVFGFMTTRKWCLVGAVGR